MADIVLPVVGAAVGFVVGGPQGAMIGAQIGTMAAGAFTRVKLPTQEGPRLADLRGQTSSYGGHIPKLYGTMRIAGNVIWSTDIKEVKVESTQNGGKGGGGRTSQTSITYEYYITLAIALCEGEIDEITRVWADAKILTEDILLSNQGKYNIHLGSEDQDIDDIMAKYIDSSILPAYRGTAYVVIEDFPLGDYGNRIPNFSFEIRRSLRFTPALEDKITDIVMIPGAGEMVYGTEVTTKQDGFFWSNNNQFIPSGDIENINMHNYEGKADVLLSLDNMQKILPNLEWVAVVVTWFATSTDAGTCRIIPKVEFYGSTMVLPQDWSVNGLYRETAERVLFLDADTPTYGGTPSDHTVVQLCDELRSRGLKVMLYPMIFVDQITPIPKPWRGRIVPSSSSEANNWFTKTEGYSELS